jgi:CBS domain-containing protein
MHVSDILASKGAAVLTIAADATVAEAARLLASKRIGAVLIGAGAGAGGLAGILSERDIVRGLAERGEHVLQEPVSTLMTRNVVVCAPEHSLDQIMGMMTERRIRHLPVVDGAKLVGVISIGDAVKHRIAEIEREAQDLRAYITAA